MTVASRQAVNVMAKIETGFMFLRNNFPKISNVKIKVGNFVSSLIKELSKGDKFDENISEDKKAIW